MIGPEEIEGYRRGFLERFPDADGHFLDWGVSCEVVINILGIDWYREHLTSSRMHPYFLSQAADATYADYMRDHRVITFGRNLFELQSAPFFDDMVPELRRRAVLGVATELHVARLFHANNHPMRFVPRTGTRGEDYDQVVTYRGQDVCVEVKADARAWTTLNRARRTPSGQLPSSAVPPACHIGRIIPVPSGQPRSLICRR